MQLLRNISEIKRQEASAKEKIKNEWKIQAAIAGDIPALLTSSRHCAGRTEFLYAVSYEDSNLKRPLIELYKNLAFDKSPRIRAANSEGALMCWLLASFWRWRKHRLHTWLMNRVYRARWVGYCIAPPPNLRPSPVPNHRISHDPNDKELMNEVSWERCLN